MKKYFSKIFENTTNKKKIENLVFFIIILIITLIILNYIWNGKSDKKSDDNNISKESVLATSNKENIDSKEELIKDIEQILNTIKGVGKVNVLINYYESSSIIPLYDETTTTNSSEEGDGAGGTRNVTEVQSQKDVVFSESSGKKEPVIQKKQTPVIQGAIVTAQGAGNSNVKNNIINAIAAITGLTIDKIQVFEMGG